jgi:hypothetical protein
MLDLPDNLGFALDMKTVSNLNDARSIKDVGSKLKCLPLEENMGEEKMRRLARV